METQYVGVKRTPHRIGSIILHLNHRTLTGKLYLKVVLKVMRNMHREEKGMACSREGEQKK